jgi:SPOR domain
MSDPYRGSYGDEPPLAFDDRRAPRRGGPAPVTLIISLLFLAAAAGGVFYLYRGGVRGPNDAPQPVGAPVRDVRSPAPAQPSESDPAAGLSIYKTDPNAPQAAPAFVPPPEQPIAKVDSTATAPPVATAAAPSAPAPAVSAARTAAPTPSAIPTAPVAASTKAATTTPKPASIDKLIADADSSPIPSKAVSASVQIGAFSSESLADKSWNDAEGVAPGSMAGKSKKVVPVTKADGTTLYRTAITGFTSREDAQALCDRLKADGKTCFVR